MSSRYGHVIEVESIPDPRDPTLGDKLDGGSLIHTIKGQAEQMARMIQATHPKEIVFDLWFTHDPKRATEDPQRRVGVFLAVQASSRKALKRFVRSIVRGPLASLYKLRLRREVRLPDGPLTGCAVLTRAERRVDPLCTPDRNPLVPPFYYSASVLDPHPYHGHERLIAMMLALGEPAAVRFRIRPVDAAPLRRAMTVYQQLLRDLARPSVSRNRSRPDARRMPYRNGDSRACFDYINTGSTGSLERNSTPIEIEPLFEADPRADDMIRDLRPLARVIDRPLVNVEASILAASTSDAAALGSALGTSAFSGGGWWAHPVDDPVDDPVYIEGVLGSARPRTDALSEMTGFRTFDRLFHGPLCKHFTGFDALATTWSVEEALGILQLPVARPAIGMGLRSHTDPPAISPATGIVIGSELLDHAAHGSAIPRGLSAASLCKHTAIFGLSGKGKTTSLFHLVHEVRRHSPDCVILYVEVEKTEARALKQLVDHRDPELARLGRAVHVHTLGVTGSEPRINPMNIPSGGARNAEAVPECLLEDLGRVSQLFAAGIPMEGSMTSFLDEAVTRVIHHARRSGRTPVPGDVQQQVNAVIRARGYPPETAANFRGAIGARLERIIAGAAGAVFRTGTMLPSLEDCRGTVQVFECHKANASGTTSLFLLSLLEAAEAFMKSNTGGGKPSVMLLIDEAHSVIGPDTNAQPSPDNADPKAHASRRLSKAMVEWRSLGGAIVISDQHPSEVSEHVIKSAGSLTSFGQTHRQDRDTLAGAMLLDPLQTEHLARLKPGEAYFLTEGYHAPRLIRTPNTGAAWGLKSPPDGKQLFEIQSRERWYVDLNQRRMAEDLELLSERLHEHEHRLKEFDARLARILTARAQPDHVRLQREAAGLLNDIREATERFRWRWFDPTIGTERHAQLTDPAVQRLRRHLIDQTDRVTDVYRHHAERLLKPLVSPSPSTPRRPRHAV